MAMYVTDSGTPDIKEKDYNDGIFDDPSNVLTDVPIEGCWDSFWSPMFKATYCGGLEFAFKASVEIFLILVIIVIACGVAYGVYYLCKQYKLHNLKNDTAKQLQRMALLDGTPMDKAQAKKAACAIAAYQAADQGTVDPTNAPKESKTYMACKAMGLVEDDDRSLNDDQIKAKAAKTMQSNPKLAARVEYTIPSLYKELKDI